MALKDVEFISSLVRCTDDTYELLLVGGNIKQDVWWITTRFIRSKFEYYLAPACSTTSKTSFDSDYQLRITLIWGVIKGHIAANKMLAKYIKDHPIVVGAYAQWLVSNSVRTEAMDTNSMATKLK